MKKLLLFILVFITTSFAKEADTVWAEKVLGFSSQISSHSYSAREALGKPSVMQDFGETPCAWMPEKISRRIEWIKVQFDKKIKASKIVIAENLNPGAIVGIFLYDSLDKGYRVYSNNEPKPLQKQGRMLNIDIPKTDYKVHSLKIEISLSDYYDHYQIDAIAVSNQTKKIEQRINIIDNQKFAGNPDKLSDNINSPYIEIAPVISASGNTIFFTRQGHPENKGNKDQDVWVSRRNSKGNFTKAENLGFPINNESDNFAISLTPDENLLLVGGVYLGGNKIGPGVSVSEFDGEDWSYPEALEINNYYNFHPTGSYCLSSNGKVLLMSVMRKDSYGLNDLYASFLKDNRTWTEPQNLGKTINTADIELSPFLASDGKTLYYSTSGKPGFGDTDMFMSKRLDETWQNWSEPKNLGNIINTSGWDAYYTITADGNYAYFASTKTEKKTADIFKIKLPKKVQPETITLIKGKILNSKTGEPLKAKIRYEYLTTGKEGGIARSNPETGEYSIVLPNGFKYGFHAEKDGFISINENLDLKDSTSYNEIIRNISLVPIEKGESVRLNNIFFDFGKHKLLKESFSELDRLYEIMQNNPSMKISVQGHTDNIGSKNANITLSKKRAQSVADYLIKKGLNKSKIKIEAFGESKPIASNKSDEGRSQNRRVEFEIIEK